MPLLRIPFLALAASAHALDASKPPGANFNLSIWTLQIPVASGASVQEIKPAELVAGYASTWLSTAEDGSMSFWCPVTGATTPNTHYPRSELRESWTGGDWTFAGHHRLEAVCRVMQVPGDGRVIIGQIHGHVGGSEIIKLYWDKGQVSAGVEPDRASEKSLPLGSAKPGDTIAYSLDMKDGNLNVTVNGKTAAWDYTGSGWKGDTYYFKAGVYVQDNTGSPSVGGRVRFYSLSVEHNGVIVRIRPARAASAASMHHDGAGPRWNGRGLLLSAPGKKGFSDAAGRSFSPISPNVPTSVPHR